MTDKYGRESAKKWMDMKPYNIKKTPAVREERWDISPEEAQRLLDSMARNRGVRRAAVERYANEMLRGDWSEFSGEISIDPDGRLIDGQHRMLAVIKAGLTVPFRVKLNVPANTPFDIGVPRSSSDDLAARGNLPPEYCEKMVVSAAGAILERALGRSAYRSLSNSEKEKFLMTFGEECRLCCELTRQGKSNGLCRAASVQAGTFAALLNGVPEETLRQFFSIANTGYAHSEEQFAAVTLNHFLEARKGETGDAARAMKQSATEQAIRDFVKGAPRRKSYYKVSFPYSDKIAGTVKEVLA